jgi:predicted nucleotidyltransferase component of viral defense system
MMEDVLRARIDELAPRDAAEQQNVLQETMQHYVLASLSRTGLFSEAIFHGGTCLRVVHRMQRFSEDLDFLLKTPDPGFRWQRYLDGVRRDCLAEGIDLEVVDRDAADAAVRKAFLKTDSVGSLLSFRLPFGRDRGRELRIKLEVDTNPPAGSAFETAFILFPRPAPLTVQTLASSFGTKLHALLCRGYVKGRDWYDFLWHVGRRTSPSLELLANALAQHGPWSGQAQKVTPEWLTTRLEEKIVEIDWPKARDDVERFLPLPEQEGLRHWGAELFLEALRGLRAYLG